MQAEVDKDQIADPKIRVRPRVIAPDIPWYKKSHYIILFSIFVAALSTIIIAYLLINNSNGDQQVLEVPISFNSSEEKNPSFTAYI